MDYFKQPYATWLEDNFTIKERIEMQYFNEAKFSGRTLDKVQRRSDYLILSTGNYIVDKNVLN